MAGKIIVQIWQKNKKFRTFQLIVLIPTWELPVQKGEKLLIVRNEMLGQKASKVGRNIQLFSAFALAKTMCRCVWLGTETEKALVRIENQLGRPNGGLKPEEAFHQSELQKMNYLKDAS
jgi:hypothetical protein